NRLQDATGLRMDVTVIFDYPTATELGEYLVEELAVPTGKGDPAATSEGRTQPGSTDGDEPTDTLVTLYLQALEAGRASDGRSLLEAASRILPVFDAPGPERIPEVAQLSSGAEKPALVCIEPPVAPMLHMAYTSFSTALPVPRDVFGVWPPGYAEGEL